MHDDFPRTPSDDADDVPGRADGSVLDTLPGIVRIAASSGLRAATWGATESVKTGVGIARRMPFGGLAVRAVEEAAEQARRSARQLLGVDEVERRLSRLVPERVSETSRAWGSARGHGASSNIAVPLGPAEVLQQRGSNLLHQAADVEFDQEVHPAYARILDELAPDEARILRLMVTSGPQASVDVRTGRPLRIGDTLIASGLTRGSAPIYPLPAAELSGLLDEAAEDPSIARSYAPAMVEGLQGRAGTAEFLGPGKVIATAKHFVGDGGTAGGKDQGENPSDDVAIRDIHGAGYPGGETINHPTNVTWGGPDLKDLYIGSIRAGYVLKARSPVAGQPHVHQLD